MHPSEDLSGTAHIQAALLQRTPPLRASQVMRMT
jgi:hypothetical protein